MMHSILQKKPVNSLSLGAEAQSVGFSDKFPHLALRTSLLDRLFMLTIAMKMYRAFRKLLT